MSSNSKLSGITITILRILNEEGIQGALLYCNGKNPDDIPFWELFAGTRDFYRYKVCQAPLDQRKACFCSKCSKCSKSKDLKH